MNPIVLVALSLLGTVLPALAETPMPPLHHYFLPNGLEVVLAPDHKVPKVVVDMHVKVGSMNEPPGRSGFAHLFEHLMFTGTDAVPDIDWTYSQQGISNNAWTWEDKTFYYSEGLSSTLPLILSVEADRMANLGYWVGDQQLAVERDIVLNEMRQNVLDTVGESAREAMRTGLFPTGHPYARSVIGSMADLAAADLEDVRDFFQTYYVPNNAVLVVVGDFDPAEAVALIGMTFGKIPRGADVPVLDIVPATPTRIRLALEDRVPAPTLVIGFSGGGQLSPDTATMPLLAEILGNQSYGILRDRLIATGLATSVSAMFERGLLGSKLIFEISCADDATPEAVETAFRAALAEYLATPVDGAELERAKRAMILAQRTEIESYSGRGERIALEAAGYGTPETGVVDNPRVAAVTPEMLDATRQAWLQPDYASVITVLPGGRGNYPAVLTESTGTPPLLSTGLPAAVAIPILGVREPAAAALPAPDTALLSNRVRVLHYQLPETPMAYLAAVSDAGTSSGRPGEEGVMQLALDTAIQGTTTLDLTALAQALADIGGTLSAGSDVRATTITLSLPSDALAGGVATFADVVQRPRFDAGEWEIQKAATVEGVRAEQADAANVAWMVSDGLLMPADATHPGPTRTLQSIGDATLERARAMFAELYTPATTTLVSVGPQSLDEVLALLEPAFGQWTSDVGGLADRPLRSPNFPGGRRVILVDEPGASQTMIYVARPAPGYDEPDFPEALSVIGTLSRDFLSRLNAVLREVKGITYGTDGYVFSALPDHSMLISSAPVDGTRTGEAVQEFLAAFASLASDPITPDEVRKSVTSFQIWQAGLAETGGGFFDEVLTHLGRGTTMEADALVNLAVIQQEAGEVRRVGAELSSLDDAVIVLVGDASIVLPQLGEIGITPTEQRSMPGLP